MQNARAPSQEQSPNLCHGVSKELVNITHNPQCSYLLMALARMPILDSGRGMDEWPVGSASTVRFNVKRPFSTTLILQIAKNTYLRENGR